MKFEPVLHFGYMVVVVSVILMLWVTYSNAIECTFDASCVCSKPPPQLGNVLCHNGPVTLPKLNLTRIHTLSLVNNDLDYIQPQILRNTGISKLHISQNPMYYLHEEALNGLQNTLYELHITHCKMSKVPGDALRDFTKLKILNLTDNEIMELTSDHLRGVTKNLLTLILSNNGLTSLPSGVFASLEQLEYLDISGNILSQFSPTTFSPPPPKLKRLNMADNLFESVPYKELLNIRTLESLDMSFNQITRVSGGPPSGKLSLNTLIFDYNQIAHLGAGSMAFFDVANRTSFRGNPLVEIEENAFRGTRIEELILAECQLSEITMSQFNDLERSLQFLDLTGNNVTIFTYSFLDKFKALRTLRLGDNKLGEISHSPEDEENRNKTVSLSELDLAGKTNKIVDLRNFKRLGNLNSLSVSKVKQSSLGPEDLQQFSLGLKTLRIKDAGLKTLNAHLFNHTRGIKTLDFTDNNIESLDSKTFLELDNLEYLILTHAFSKKISNFPSNIFKSLSSLKVLKLNHNGLKTLPTDINTLRKLEIFHAHDNVIESIQPNLFKGDQLVEINLSFNKISKLSTSTFHGLDKLDKLYLSDNTISQIDKGAFLDLQDLSELHLRGNRLSSLPVEAFQNLPNLQVLDMAYNSLKEFSFSSLEEVGVCGDLSLNISHNQLHVLNVNVSSLKDTGNVIVKVLDMSYNNMTHMGPSYLHPIRQGLTHLYLSHNSLKNITRDLLPEMSLELLDLSHNLITDIEFDSFKHLPKLQVISLAHNNIQHIREELFASLNNLRRIDLSHNLISSMKDSSIKVTSLARMDLSHNSLTRAPLNIFFSSTYSCLLEFDISNNKITVLPPAESFGRFTNLRKLDISNNRIAEIGTSLSSLPNIAWLNIAHNYIHIGGKDFAGVEHTLQHLDLTNISISYIPPLPLPSLLTLKLSQNTVTYLPPEMTSNLTSLRYLDLSHNGLQTVPSFPQLNFLDLGGNDIDGLFNNSFKNYPVLTDLGIHDLPLTEFDEDSLEDLVALKTLHISNYKSVPGFRLPEYISTNKALRTLHVDVTKETQLSSDMQGELPSKVRHIMLSGREVKNIPEYVLRGVQYPELKITLRNTSVETLPESLFNNLPRIRNISLDLYNNTLKTLGNPSNVGAIGVPRKTFLKHLEMQGNQWTCDCQIGWIETWQRKKRQYSYDFDSIEEIREAKCKNKQNKPLLNILKADLECGWSTGSISTPKVLVLVTVSIISFLFSN